MIGDGSPRKASKRLADAVSAHGVYLLFKRRELVYVGRSKNPAQRIAAHVRNGRPFDHSLVLECAPEDVDWVERALISALNPPQNRLGVVTPREPEPDVREIIRYVEVEVPVKVAAAQRNPHEVISLRRVHDHAQRLGLLRECKAALASGEIPSVRSNPASTSKSAKRLVTWGDLDAWCAARIAQREEAAARQKAEAAAAGWRVS